MSNDDDPLDKRAQAILEAVRACWRHLSDLNLAEDRLLALDKLHQMLAMEVLSHEPAHAPEKRH
jgi:hypothetical protein